MPTVFSNLSAAKFGNVESELAILTVLAVFFRQNRFQFQLHDDRSLFSVPNAYHLDLKHSFFLTNHTDCHISTLISLLAY
jgi:hypothetical protein